MPTSATGNRNSGSFSTVIIVNFFKLVISTAGDEFFLPDDTYYWLTEMKGPTFYRLLPNTEHSTSLSGLTTKHYFWSLRHFFLQTMMKQPLPDFCTMRYTKNNGVKETHSKYLQTFVKYWPIL